MTIQPIYLLYGVIFLGAFLLLEGMYYLLVDNFGGRRGANRRMRMLSAGDESKKVFAQLRRIAPKTWDYLGPFGDLLNRLNHLITQAGLAMSTPRLLVLMAVLSGFLFIAVLMVASRSSTFPLGLSTATIAAAFSLIVGIAGPFLYLLMARSRRLKKFAEQLPDALDMMVRSLKAGHPVSVAMGLAAQQMPDPIGTEIGIAVDEMTYGLDLREALENMGERIKIQEFEYVVVAISIQHDTGGNLADVLGGLATVIRSRFRMFKKIKALSAEGRFSAKILGALPFAFAAMTFSAKPNYYLDVANEPMFIKVIVLALVLQFLGIFIMHKLINFRV